MRNGGRDLTWSWDGGVRGSAEAKNSAMGAGGPFGLLAITLVAGVVSGVAEALGTFFNTSFGFLKTEYDLFIYFRSRIDRRQS